MIVNLMADHPPLIEFESNTLPLATQIYQAKDSGWERLKISGPDASSFLLRLTTIHPDRLIADQWQPFAILNDKSMILALGWIIKQDKITFECLAQGPSLFERMEAMHFSEDLQMSREPVSVCLSTKPTEGSLAQWQLQGQDSVDDKWWLSIHQLTPELADQTLIPSSWKQMAPVLWKHGLWTFPEILTGVGILEAGLTNALHEQKGCYPGQEVIEITITRKVSPPQKVVFIKPKEVSFGLAGLPNTLTTQIQKADTGAVIGRLIAMSPEWGVAVLRKGFNSAGDLVQIGEREWQVY